VHKSIKEGCFLNVRFQLLSVAEISELRFCLQWTFKHAPLSRIPICVSWAFLVLLKSYG